MRGTATGTPPARPRVIRTSNQRTACGLETLRMTIHETTTRSPWSDEATLCPWCSLSGAQNRPTATARVARVSLIGSSTPVARHARHARHALHAHALHALHAPLPTPYDEFSPPLTPEIHPSPPVFALPHPTDLSSLVCPRLSMITEFTGVVDSHPTNDKASSKITTIYQLPPTPNLLTYTSPRAFTLGMPYTPPSHRSPASSVSNSPDVSRRSSFQSAPRPNLPRSASYLRKHRRASSFDGTGVSSISSTNGADDTKAVVLKDMGGSVRQSPPPRVDDNELIPKGAVISPPDSTASGSDDEVQPKMTDLELEALKDLRDAVSKISKPTTPPPQHTQPKVTIPPSLHTSHSTSALSDMHLGGRGRRTGHVRCASEPHAPSLKKPESSSTASEEDTDEDLKYKPQMVRKKSGELVRPALRGHRRPSSMPGTPLYSKAVHFDSHLEHVRHFLQVDRPLAVSAGSSPVETYESDAEYPFPRSGLASQASPPFEWELSTPNFPHDSLIRKSMPVRLEKVWLSNDQKSLLGSVAVANLAFSKSVICRFTLDYWKTVSEVNAEYSHEIRPRESSEGQDRFTFIIKLSDLADLESKTLFFCIRYAVNGREYWDNNDATNFQVDFKKKYLPQNGKNNFQGAGSNPLGGLPRSNRRQNSRSTALRPLSMPSSLDAFGNEKSVFNFDQPFHEYLGEPETAGGLRFKSKSSSGLASDNIATDLVSPSGVAFSNRYDFSASLDAAVKAAKDTTSGQQKVKEADTLYMKKNFRDAAPFSANTSTTGMSGPPAPSLPSASYEELVNKYCFFGSATKQSSPTMRDGSLKVGATDEQRGQQARGGAGLPKVSATIDEPVPHSQHAGAAAHHSMYHASTKPYFSATSSPQNTNYLISSPALRQESFTIGLPPNRGRTTPPTLASGSRTHGGDAVAERFPWTADAHAATAIQS
ncbi:hypothetical protein E4U41_004063 [Claviceps citrina]|nr:hypothetical protein E4U41_004063 [Claviceps citrina]